MIHKISDMTPGMVVATITPELQGDIENQDLVFELPTGAVHNYLYTINSTTGDLMITAVPGVEESHWVRVTAHINIHNKFTQDIRFSYQDEVNNSVAVGAQATGFSDQNNDGDILFMPGAPVGTEFSLLITDDAEDGAAFLGFNEFGEVSLSDATGAVAAAEDLSFIVEQNYRCHRVKLPVTIPYIDPGDGAYPPAIIPPVEELFYTPPESEPEAPTVGGEGAGVGSQIPSSIQYRHFYSVAVPSQDVLRSGTNTTSQDCVSNSDSGVGDIRHMTAYKFDEGNPLDHLSIDMGADAVSWTFEGTQGTGIYDIKVYWMDELGVTHTIHDFHEGIHAIDSQLKDGETWSSSHSFSPSDDVQYINLQYRCLDDNPDAAPDPTGCAQFNTITLS